MCSKVRRAKSKDDFETWKESEVTNTMNNFDNGDVRATDVVICLEGNGSRPSHHGDGYSQTDKMYSLNTVERHAVAYTVDEKMGQTYIHEEQANTLAARDYKQPQAVVAIDRAAYNQGENAKFDISIDDGGVAQTVVARGPGAVCYKKQLAHSAPETTKELEASMSRKEK